jgi:hypothetical protein
VTVDRFVVHKIFAHISHREFRPLQVQKVGFSNRFYTTFYKIAVCPIVYRFFWVKTVLHLHEEEIRQMFEFSTNLSVIFSWNNFHCSTLKMTGFSYA